MKLKLTHIARLFVVAALFAACSGIEAPVEESSFEQHGEESEVLSFDEMMTLVDNLTAEDEATAAEEEGGTVDKLAGRDGCPNDMTKAASRTQGITTPTTPLYCRLEGCVAMGTRRSKTETICFGPPPPFQVCSTGVVWEYLAANRNASSIMCADEIQAKFGF